MSKPELRFRVVGSDRLCRVLGQEARTLEALRCAGDAGVTAQEISSWALRLAHYCMKLRKLGLAIEMQREHHKGPVPGWHGRYFLKTPVEILTARGAA
jgi:hypothetical protein